MRRYPRESGPRGRIRPVRVRSNRLRARGRRLDGTPRATPGIRRISRQVIRRASTHSPPTEDYKKKTQSFIDPRAADPYCVSSDARLRSDTTRVGIDHGGMRPRPVTRVGTDDLAPTGSRQAVVDRRSRWMRRPVERPTRTSIRGRLDRAFESISSRHQLARFSRVIVRGWIDGPEGGLSPPRRRPCARPMIVPPARDTAGAMEGPGHRSRRGPFRSSVRSHSQEMRRN